MSNSSISPRRQRCAATGGNKVVDGDAASNRYMYHRALSPCAATTPTWRRSPTSSITVARRRLRHRRLNSDTSSVVEWAGEGLPPRVANFQKDFITKYLDPTEIYGRMDQLTTQFPDLIEAIPLPNKTDGYQRPGMAMMAGTTERRPRTRTRPTRRSRCSCSRRPWAIWAATTSPPSSRTPAADECAAVDHGDRRHVARPMIPPTRTPATASARSRSRPRTSSSTSPPTAPAR